MLPLLLPVADEVQRMLLPQVPDGSGKLDTVAQADARRVLKVRWWLQLKGLAAHTR